MTTPVVDIPPDPPAGAGSGVALVEVAANGGKVVAPGSSLPSVMVVVLVKVGLLMTRVTTLGRRTAKAGVASREVCAKDVSAPEAGIAIFRISYMN